MKEVKLDLSAQAIITNYHRPGGLNKRKFIFL